MTIMHSSIPNPYTSSPTYYAHLLIMHNSTYNPITPISMHPSHSPTILYAILHYPNSYLNHPTIHPPNAIDSSITLSPPSINESNSPYP